MQWLFELARLLVSRGITVGLGRLQPLLGKLLCFGFDLAAEELQVAGLHDHQRVQPLAGF